MRSDACEKRVYGWKGWMPVGGIRKIRIGAETVLPGKTEIVQSRVSTLCPFFAEPKGVRPPYPPLTQVWPGNRLTANQLKACHV